VAGINISFACWSLIDAAQHAGYPGELVSGNQFLTKATISASPRHKVPIGMAGPGVHSGRMTSGFALIAWPAVFESSGIMTFIVGPDGDVYQRDLGPDTARIAVAMTTFDPDLAWSRVAMTNE
jgi:hypothetical protein